MPAKTEELPNQADLQSVIGLLQPTIARVLDRALAGADISVSEAVTLFDATGMEFNALSLVADELRRRTVGDLVTYVVNRGLFPTGKRDSPPGQGSPGIRSDRSLHPGGIASPDGRRPLHQVMPDNQGRTARHTHSWVLP